MRFKFTSGPMTYEGEVRDQQSVFDAVGKLRGVLIPGPCGVCKSHNTYPASRKIKDNIFYEHVCGDCTATRRIVKLDDGRMFASEKNKNKQPLPNGGWSVYKPKVNGQAGGFGDDGYRAPPSRQNEAPAGAHTGDDEIPW